MKRDRLKIIFLPDSASGLRRLGLPASLPVRQSRSGRAFVVTPA
ncbi:hypothetical protein [Brevundimonas sp.]|nr:hypothetical protein [Brevundimonas sp.]